jgi:hypothetical protein
MTEREMRSPGHLGNVLGSSRRNWKRWFLSRVSRTKAGKVAFPDPAAAPLGSDEEAGEMTTLEEAKEKAHQAELRRTKNARRDEKKSG